MWAADASLEASLKAMAAKLPENQKQELGQSLALLGMKQGMAQAFANLGQNKPPANSADVLKPWHGKTAQQIIDEAKAQKAQLQASLDGASRGMNEATEKMKQQQAATQEMNDKLKEAREKALSR